MANGAAWFSGDGAGAIGAVGAATEREASGAAGRAWDATALSSAFSAMGAACSRIWRATRPAPVIATNDAAINQRCFVAMGLLLSTPGTSVPTVIESGISLLILSRSPA